MRNGYIVVLTVTTCCEGCNRYYVLNIDMSTPADVVWRPLPHAGVMGDPSDVS
jgi:hypothetical protein